ncbi:LuxR family transcriptional regulator [Streptomyces sp. DH37]|uniref:helix-turn-helix transcriptional regulator n=1 Tax=Streptomyces sp. DH37 TaxID=3040122 RepID=UPI00244174F5|nr:LuxR family transcriptional regulator [Streptomyces sp. DH37]MDG9706429.1 LuxR family transcriptional regulator [Streptomyces sp. DH37]
MCGPPGDEFEYALLQVRELIESTVVIHRDRNRREQLITAVTGGQGRVLEVAGDLVERADRSVDILYSRVPGPGEGPEQAGWPQGDLLHRARDRVATRLLVSPELAGESLSRGRPGPAPGPAVRVARLPPLQVFITDATTALVVAGSAAGRRASLIRAPEMLQVLHTLFESIWSSSVPALRRIVCGDRDRTVLIRQILAALRAGVTDEVAARELTVSVRTYRRYVAEIMALLGANSRFQAGVRAAELGLLPPVRSSWQEDGPRP